MRHRLALLAVGLCATLAAAVPATQAATTRSCGSVKNPYPGTRYAGVPLSHITATGVSCTTAKRVAKGAHKKALGLTPSASGIRSFSWEGLEGERRPARRPRQVRRQQGLQARALALLTVAQSGVSPSA